MLILRAKPRLPVHFDIHLMSRIEDFPKTNRIILDVVLSKNFQHLRLYPEDSINSL